MAKVFVLLFGIIVFVSGEPDISNRTIVPEEAIIGGQDAREGQFPYMVSLRYYNSHFFGGSIIDPKWVLTAAHCTKVIKNFVDFDIVVGTTSLTTGGVRYKGEKVINNKGFLLLRTFIKGDVALIKVKGNGIEFNNLIQPIALCQKTPRIYSKVVLSGWGLIRRSDTRPTPNLQFLNYRTLNYVVCFLKNLPLITWPDSICTQSTIWYGACLGDSGGPLVYKDQQIGIPSFVRGCALGYPDGYSSVCHYRKWILNTMATN